MQQGSKLQSSRRRTWPVVGALALGWAGLAGADAGPTNFHWFRASAPPSSWKQLGLPGGAAVLSYPPSLVKSKSDSDAVTAAAKNAAGLPIVYLNATARQGNEDLATWPKWRISTLLDESASSAKVIAQVYGLRFRGGFGSCVLDDYVTKKKSHHFREIACYVVGAKGGSVVVVATLQSAWQRNLGLVERAVEAYRAA